MSSQFETIKARLDDLTRRHATAKSKKTKLQGQLEAKRQELANLADEIREAGYDPKNLKKERDKLEAEIETMMDQFERELVEVEEALATFDK
jgi:chromosome segregation ATPase